MEQGRGAHGIPYLRRAAFVSYLNSARKTGTSDGASNKGMKIANIRACLAHLLLQGLGLRHHVLQTTRHALLVDAITHPLERSAVLQTSEATTRGALASAPHASGCDTRRTRADSEHEGASFPSLQPYKLACISRARCLDNPNVFRDLFVHPSCRLSWMNLRTTILGDVSTCRACTPVSDSNVKRTVQFVHFIRMYIYHHTIPTGVAEQVSLKNTLFLNLRTPW